MQVAIGQGGVILLPAHRPSHSRSFSFEELDLEQAVASLEDPALSHLYTNCLPGAPQWFAPKAPPSPDTPLPPPSRPPPIIIPSYQPPSLYSQKQSPHYLPEEHNQPSPRFPPLPSRFNNAVDSPSPVLPPLRSESPLEASLRLQSTSSRRSTFPPFERERRQPTERERRHSLERRNSLERDRRQLSASEGKLQALMQRVLSEQSLSSLGGGSQQLYWEAGVQQPLLANWGSGYFPLTEYSFDRPLPCFGCGIGWCLFVVGFLCPVAWYIGALLFFCLHNPRERTGLQACMIAAGFATIVVVVVLAVLSARHTILTLTWHRLWS